MRGRALRRKREALGLRQAEVARQIARADGRGAITDALLSSIETEAIRLPRRFSALYLAALRLAALEREWRGAALAALEQEREEA